MIDTDSAMKSHLGNLSRALGHDVGKYQYILNSNDVLKSYYESKKDLPYPLRKETKRDRYIYNSDGLQKDLIDIVNNAMMDAEKELSNMVSDDIVNMVYNKMNGIVGAASSSKSTTNKTAAAFGKALANSLMSNLSKIYDELSDPN